MHRAPGAGNDIEPTGIATGNLLERGDCPIIALHSDHPPRARGEEGAGKATGTGADLQHVHALERAGRARNPRG